MKMKKNILILCLGIFALISCSKDDEAVYSCDPQVNNWVKANKSKIDEMDRTEWLQISESKKIPSYRAFTRSQKQIFWLLKLDEVVQLGNWSNDEKLHLEKFIKKITDNPQWFDENFSKDENGMMEMEKFAYEWKNEAKQILGWSDFFIKSIASTGNKVVDKKGSLQIAVIKSNVRFKIKTSEPSPSSCNCGIGYFWSTCDSSISNTDCKDDGCKVTIGGCSFLWTSNCDGTCSPG
jgi:hypothetical protein